MLISCEKCSTTYVLEDAVIPPQGAPVQCTRCGHVFTARHPAASPETKPNTATLMFAAPTAAEAPAPPKPNLPSQTMVFGAVSPPSGPPGGKTVVFGALEPPAPARQPNPPTFGTAAHHARGTQAPPKQAGARSETVIFGTPGAQPAPDAAPTSPGPSNQTVLFGLGPDVPAAPPDAKSQTMMFGRTSGKPTPKVTVADSPAFVTDARDSTVRVDLDSVAPVAAPAETAKTRQDRARPHVATDEIAPPEAPAISKRTVLFAMNPSEEAAKSEPGPLLDADLAGPANPNQTMMYAGGAVISERSDPDPTPLPQAEDEGASFEASSPDLPGGDHQQVDLPPDMQHGEEPLSESPEADDVEIASMRASSNRRTTIAVVVFLVIALLMGLALAWYLFGRALVSGDNPRIEKEVRAALATLRKDDDASQEATATQARAILVAHPESISARSALVIALAFLADDANAEALRARGRVTELKGRVAGLSDASPGIAAVRTQLAQAELRAGESSATSLAREASLKSEVVALRAQAAEKEHHAAERLATLRALAVAAGVMGEVSALALAEEFRQNASGPDNWAELALPEYVVNGGSSFDEALKQLKEVEVRDDTFLRAYVLSARIHLLQHNTEGAQAQLARVLAFHPGHDSARLLQEWILTHTGNN